MASRNVTGHVKLVKRQRSAKWYVKYRLPDGRQVRKMLGPAWTERGRRRTATTPARRPRPSCAGCLPTLSAAPW